ncbi:MAG: PIN domain-containing protein [Clostridiales Family XIII bacterium]|nr:PIN domain-containing protein [Clostridiales Family XIII bacterium]
MRVYLDNCCFNRPFDEQTSIVIRLETDAKLHIQELIRSGKAELCWSFVLDYENAAHPFDEVRNRILEWKALAALDCDLSSEVSEKATELMTLGLRQMDAAHIACAIALGADCFLTTDKKILNKPITGIAILNPIDFLRRYVDEE